MAENGELFETEALNAAPLERLHLEFDAWEGPLDLLLTLARAQKVDLAQISIPTDRVEPAYLRQPQRWDIRSIRRFMWIAGPISSAFDFVTFFVLLHVFHFTAVDFHTGWFVESLATQTLVLLVIRAVARPWRDRPSLPLVATTLAVVEMFTVFARSPPVPTISTPPVAAMSIGAACASIVSASARSSSTVSPFAARATRNAPRTASEVCPDMIRSIAHAVRAAPMSTALSMASGPSTSPPVI